MFVQVPPPTQRLATAGTFTSFSKFLTLKASSKARGQAPGRSLTIPGAWAKTSLVFYQMLPIVLLLVLIVLTFKHFLLILLLPMI